LYAEGVGRFKGKVRAVKVKVKVKGEELSDCLP